MTRNIWGERTSPRVARIPGNSDRRKRTVMLRSPL
jgi:hypothetical protein